MQKIFNSIVLNREKSGPSWLLATFALCYYILVAYKSSGFIQADEHYQIIEFANYKLGLLSMNKLAWEFEANVRSGLQPLLCFIILKVLRFLGITGGYELAFGLRAFTACISILVITYFIKAYKKSVNQPLLPYFVCISYFVWFLPYINVRFSSETWSGLFLILALAQIQRFKDSIDLRRCATIGMLLGIAIVLRFQSALFVTGILLWLTFVEKIHLKKLTISVSAILLILCLGVLVDYWLYGKLTITAYNYFVVNIVQGKANSFGISPFYTYIIYIITAPGPFGIIIVASFLILCYRDIKNPIVWAMIPFLLVHSLIPHKESRFVFPLANLCPVVCILAFQHIYNIWPKAFGSIRSSKVGYALAAFLFLADAAGLIAVATTGAGPNLVSVSEYIHRHYSNRKTNVIFNGDLWIYYDMPFAKNSYYSSEGILTDRVVSIWQSDLSKHKRVGCKNILVISNNDITGPRSLNLMKSLGLTRVYQSIPYITEYIYSLYDGDLNKSQIFVYEFAN